MKKIIIVFISSAFLLTACSAIGLGGPTATPTVDRAATAEARSIEETQAAEDAQATTVAQATQVAMEEATGTAIFEATQEEEERIADETATAESIASATALAQPMADTLADLEEEGYISSTAGTYYQLDEFDESWAQINYFDGWPTGHSPDDFVVRADISWDSASDTANWFNSGCGFIFRGSADASSFYVVFLTLDGYVDMKAWSSSGQRSLGFSYFGRLDVPDGSAEMLLVVEGTTFRVFINDRLVHTRSDSSYSEGVLAYTLLSGTNAGFGTRCVFENVDLWELEGE